MSPRKRSRTRGVAFATSAAVAAVLASAFIGVMVKLASSGAVKNQLGESTFIAGRTRDYAPQIDQSGPLLFNDLGGGTRQVYLQHLGGDRKLGWVAIQGHVEGEAKACVLRWAQTDRRFHDPCSSTTYPADGTGLVRYPVTVLPSDRLSVDLRTPLPAGTTVTTGPASA